MDALRLPVWLTVCALIIILVRKQKPEFAVLASIAAGITAFFLIKDELVSVVEWMTQLQDMIPESGDAASVMLKAGGIALVSEFASDLCTDAGEKALAGRIDLAERVFLTAMCLPFAARLLQRVTEIMP